MSESKTPLSDHVFGVLQTHQSAEAFCRAMEIALGEERFKLVQLRAELEQVRESCLPSPEQCDAELDAEAARLEETTKLRAEVEQLRDKLRELCGADNYILAVENEKLRARVAEFVTGRIIEIGDIEALGGKPGLVIETTREQLRAHGRNLVFCEVEIRRSTNMRLEERSAAE